jgi:hypothetical protein
MDVQLGYTLLRDRRVSLRPKLIALAIGAAVVGFTELLQIPLESLFAVILPMARLPKTFGSIVTAVIAQSDAGFQWI